MPAANLASFFAEDDDSDLKLWYAVGDYPGGTNVVGWTEMRGASLLAPAILPCGVPLYFLVRARNSQGLETTGRCSIATYDCTFPDGRADSAYRCSSHSSKLSANVILFEDSELKTDKLFHAVGYSPSSYGHEVVDWLPLTLSNSQPQPGVSGDLRHFNPARPGRLTSTPKKSVKASSASLVIVDGKGSTTVLNGNRRGQELRYTIENYQASANWDGFKDEECGIYGYAFAVGSTACGSDVASFRDPHASIHNPDDWHHSGLVKDLHLADGPYYVTVQAVNDIIHGGDLVTTVCHSTPFVVDTAPPFMNSVEEILFDETFRFLVVYFNATDVTSGVARTEFGLGRTKFHWGVGLTPGDDDVVPFHILSAYDKQSCIEVELQHAFTYFSTVVAFNKALNQKSTNTTSNGLLVDVTPPIPGNVSDGDDINNDIDFTSETATITTTWSDFRDPESGLTPYSLSVSINQQLDKVFTDINAETFTDHSFSFQHDGMLVDHTPPDLLSISTKNQTQYQQRDDVLHFIWQFKDPESGVAEYRCVIYKLHQGRKSKFWPAVTDFYSIRLNTTSSSHGELHLDGLSLENGAEYSLAVTALNRAKMATAEESNGVTVDTTPPRILKVSLARLGEAEELNDDYQVEQVEGEPLWVTWTPHDTESGIEESQICIGLAGTNDCISTFTRTVKVASKQFLVLKANVAGVVLDDILPYSDFGLVVDDHGNGFAQAHITQVERQTYFSTVRAITGHSCHEEYIVSSSDGLTLDTTPPSVTFNMGARQMTSDEVVYQTVGNTLQIAWKAEDDSGVNETVLTLGLFEDNPMKIRVAPVPSEPIVLDTVRQSGDSIYSSIAVSDNAGNDAVLPLPLVTFDFSPPVLVDMKCTDVVSTVASVLACNWLSVKEEHGELSEIKFGLGSGHSVPNLLNFTSVPRHKGVAISPEPRLEVWDGPGDTDIDGQAEMNVMQGSWSYSDPCPVLSAEWSLREVGGKMITNFTAILGKTSMFYSDALGLENFKVYVNYVRIRDAMNRTFTAFSDGITISVRQPEPATVRDGLTLADQDFQEATDRLSANWDDFGDSQSSLPSDDIVKYEAAVGTDRRYTTTRANIHTFTDIGLATNVTFYGMNLTAKVVTYFITVRAYSGAGSFIESSSDGIKVGFSADMVPGQVLVDRYQSSVSSVRFSWTDFVSDMVITHYLVGVSTTAPPWDNSTYDCTDLVQNSGFVFDVYTLQVLDGDSLAVVEGVNLRHGSAYHVTVVAEDKMGRCSAAISDEVIVDTTPPFAGHISADGVNAETVIFLHSDQTVVISLEEFPDPESGVRNVEVELYQADSCDPEKQRDSWIPLSKISAVNESRVAMRNLQLHVDTFYFLKATVANGAGLQTTATSRPLMLDTTPPLPGLVKLGTDWAAADRTFQKEAAEELRQFQLPTYYLDVRVVDHSGLATDTKSVGIVVDTSPPVVKSFYCTDPEYKSDIETMYLGNNHTVGVKWDVYEDITSVQSVSLSVVTLSLPNVTMTKVGDVDIGVLENTERLELDLNLDPSTADDLDVEYFEWGIGTSDGREDVFPKTVIGTKNAKKVVIVNGFIQVDGFSEDFSVGDYAKQNFTSDTKPDPSANTFEMEPGRCMEQRMYGVSKSHVATAIELPPVCIKRPDDVMLEADGVPHELWISNSTSVDGSPTSADSMRVKVKLSRGAIVAGMLRERDLDVQYGSSASTEFSPFIIHPDPLADPSSRWLRKRLESMPGPKIFLSPVAKAQLSEDVEVTYAVPADVDIPDDSTVMLVFWNPERREWETSQESCSLGSQSFDEVTRVVTTKLCARVFSNSPDSAESRARRRRNAPTSSTASATLGPRMVTMAVVSKTVPNLPPVIQNPFFTMLEDSGLQDFTITYTDDEGDAVVFALARQPAHGAANVTENGLLQYRPDPDFSGTDLIYVLGREMLDPRNIALGVIPNTVAFSISAHVTGVNDPPDIIFLPPQNNSAVTCETAGSPTAGWGVNVSVFVEGNTTTLAALGTLLLTDVDQGDTFTYLDASHVTRDADFVVSDIVHTDIQKYDVSGTYVMGGKEVALNMTDGYSGHVLVAIILCPIVAVLLGVFAFYKLKKKKSSKVGQCISQVTVSARTVSDIDCTAVTEEPGNAMTNKTDTAVVQEVREDPEFFKLPLFTFQPAPNPAASRITTTGLFGVKGENRDVTKVKKRQLRKTAAKYTIREDVLYHDGILVAKRNQVPEILQEFHDNYVSGGHLGMNKTYKKVLERYFWHGMKQEVEDYCRSCCVCQNMNACRKKPAAPLHPIPVPKKKWSLVGMDIIGPLQVTDRGNQYIVALTDHFTKFPVAKAIPCKSSEEVARFMYETICIFGAFDSLITDQGREFINFALDILTDRFNINHRISSAYHPETNGQRERDNRTLKDTLVKITDNDDWDELLPAALFAYRTSVHKSTQFSPFLALYGEQAKLPFDVTGDANEQDLNEEIMDTMKGIHEEVKNKIGENISRAQKKQKEYYDSRRAYDHGFRIGDKVLIINAARVHRMGGKMAPRFVGPYEVISVLPKGRLQLKNTKSIWLPAVLMNIPQGVLNGSPGQAADDDTFASCLSFLGVDMRMRCTQCLAATPHFITTGESRGHWVHQEKRVTSSVVILLCAFCVSYLPLWVVVPLDNTFRPQF
nr:hypothetical protein BaRGS_032819 [Batillaria attramentaria]